MPLSRLSFAERWTLSISCLLTLVLSTRTVGAEPAPRARLLWEVRDVGEFEGISADGASLYTTQYADKKTTILVWDLKSGKLVRRHTLPVEPISDAWRTRTLGQGRYFVHEQANRMLIVDLKTGMESTIDAPDDIFVRFFAWSPTAKFLVRYNGNFQAAVIETATGKTVLAVGAKDAPDSFTMYGKVDHFGFAADEKHFWTLGRESDGSHVRLWETTRWKLEKDFPHVRGRPVSSPDGNSLVVPDGPPAKSDKEREHIICHGGPGHLKVWDLRRKLLRGEIPQENLRELAEEAKLRYSPDSRFMTVNGGSVGRDPSLQLWDAATVQLKATFPVSTGINYIQFSPDGSKLAIPEDGNRMQMIDLASQARRWQKDFLSRRPFHFSKDSTRIYAESFPIAFFNVADGNGDGDVSCDRYDCSLGATLDGRHFTLLEFQAGLPSEFDATWRVVRIDTGREVFRRENLSSRGNCRFHVTDDGTLIMFRREADDSHSMSRWKISR
jgi:hypothetical protein